MNKKKMKKIPRGIRNCNPLNIRKSGNDRWLGQCGNDGAFVKFIDIKHGLRAAFRLLYTYGYRYNLRTIKDIICRWAPPFENNTTAYLQRVCSYTGMEADDCIHVECHEFKDKACRLVAAMSFIENGGDYLSVNIIREAYDMAFPKKEKQ